MLTVKIKTGKALIMILGVGMTLTMYQNCSKVRVDDMLAGSASNKATGDTVAVATDQDGNVIPVVTGNTDASAPAGEPKKDCDAKKDDGKKDDKYADATDKDDNYGDEGLEAACNADSKTIHNKIDVAQFENQEVTLDLIKGKTLIYSSKVGISLKSLNITAAVGRTILCGVKIDKLCLKKGRLEVYNSEIKEMGEQRGVLIKDGNSILPQGY